MQHVGCFTAEGVHTRYKSPLPKLYILVTSCMLLLIAAKTVSVVCVQCTGATFFSFMRANSQAQARLAFQTCQTDVKKAGFGLYGQLGTVVPGWCQA